MSQYSTIERFFRIHLHGQSPQHLEDTFFHFLRGLIGKCYGKNIFKRKRMLQSNLEILHRKGVGLAGTCGRFINNKKLVGHITGFINRIYGNFSFICRDKHPVMFFYLSQFLSFLVMPLTLVILLFLCGMILLHKRVGKKLLWLGVALLLFFSNVYLANYAMYLWEPDFKAMD